MSNFYDIWQVLPLLYSKEGSDTRVKPSRDRLHVFQPSCPKNCCLWIVSVNMNTEVDQTSQRWPEIYLSFGAFILDKEDLWSYYHIFVGVLLIPLIFDMELKWALVSLAALSYALNLISSSFSHSYMMLQNSTRCTVLTLPCCKVAGLSWICCCQLILSLPVHIGIVPQQKLIPFLWERTSSSWVTSILLRSSALCH